MAKDSDTKTAQEAPEADAPAKEEEATGTKETEGVKEDSNAPPKPTVKPTAKPEAKTTAKAAAKATLEPKVATKPKAEPKKEEKKTSETKPTAISADPLPEDEPATEASSAEKATAKPAIEKPRERPRDIPYRSRHPEPEVPRGGGPGRLIITIAVFLALVFLILSFANSRSFRIVDTGGSATLMRGTFLPWGQMTVEPAGGDVAFYPLPWVDPPAGAATRGSLRKVADTFYAMLYLNAGEAQIDTQQFDAYDMQASALEVWFDDRFGATPEAVDEFNELRSRVRARRKATEEYREKREDVLLLIEDMLATLPDRVPAHVEADADRFRLFLDEVRASDQR